MKKALLVIGILLLTACGGDSTVNAGCDKQYWDGTVGACLPSDWIVIDEATLRQRGVTDDTVVAFQAKDAVAGQFLTATITREALSEVVTPADYSEASIRSVSILPGYEFIDATKTDVDGESVTLHVFTAQPRSDEAKRRFYQISTVHGDMGYTITGTGPVSLSDAHEKAMLTVLQSLTFQGEDEA